MSENIYQYRARIEEGIDGDTVDLVINLGFGFRFNTRFRITEVDTAELPSYYYFPSVSLDDLDYEEYEEAIDQTRFVRDFLNPDTDEKWPLTIYTNFERGKYGRWLADVYVENQSLSESILEKWPEAEYE